MRWRIGALVSIVSIAVSLPVVAGDLYGAIAYSQLDGRWGHAYDYGSESAANRAAMGYCRDAGGRGCGLPCGSQMVAAQWHERPARATGSLKRA